MASEHESAQERTERPTPRRREDARREGRVAQSRDLVAALSLLGAVGVWALGGGRVLHEMAASVEYQLALTSGTALTPDVAIDLLAGATATGLALAAPLVLVPAALAVGALLAQTRLVVSTKTLRPQWRRINPLATLSQLFGGHGLVELLKSVLKLTIVAGVAYATVRAHWEPLLTVPPVDIAGSVSVVGAAIGDLALRAGVAYLALGILDYGYQWWRHEKSLRMTKDEIRRETREQEGDPFLRGRIRALQRRVAMRRMMADVKRADVVIRNPIHVAVALRYEAGRMRAPRVVAKGERLLALRIIEIAHRHGVPVLENPPLARALARGAAVGREIPPELYRAVAEVLAYVYALRGRRA